MTILAVWDELAMINGISMESKRVIVPLVLQSEKLEQLYSSNMRTEKTTLLAKDSMYSINIYADIADSKELLNVPWLPTQKKNQIQDNSIQDTN